MVDLLNQYLNNEDKCSVHTFEIKMVNRPEIQSHIQILKSTYSYLQIAYFLTTVKQIDSFISYTTSIFDEIFAFKNERISIQKLPQVHVGHKFCVVCVVFGSQTNIEACAPFEHPN